MVYENINKFERVSAFIDGSNFYHSTLKIGGKIKFKKLIQELVGERKLINVFYYVANLDITIDEKKYWQHKKIFSCSEKIFKVVYKCGSPREHLKFIYHQKFLNILRKIPKFNIVLCTLKKIKKKDGNFDFILKGDDINLAIDLVDGANKDRYDTAILVSGDEDFVPAIKIVQREGKRVENIYFSISSSNTLRVICNSSLCLDKMIDKIT